MDKAAHFVMMALLAASVVGHVDGARSWVDYAIAGICSTVVICSWLAPESLISMLVTDMFGAGVVMFHVTAMISGGGGCGCFGKAQSIAMERMLVAVYLLAASIVSMKNWQRSRS